MGIYLIKLRTLSLLLLGPHIPRRTKCEGQWKKPLTRQHTSWSGSGISNPSPQAGGFLPGCLTLGKSPASGVVFCNSRRGGAPMPVRVRCVARQANGGAFHLTHHPDPHIYATAAPLLGSRAQFVQCRTANTRTPAH